MSELSVMFDNLHFYFYQSVIVVSLIGLYITIATDHCIKKLIGLGLFQGAIFAHLILLAYAYGGAPPILRETASSATLVNPLPHVLVLTAIVVAIATLSLAFALVAHIYRGLGSLDEGRISD